MNELVLIKLGGSVITDKSRPFTAKPVVIRNLAKEIKRKYLKKGSSVIIGHGSGSFAHVPASKYKTHLGLVNKKSVLGFSLTADAAIKINRIVISEFLKLRIPVASFAPLSFIYRNNLIYEHIKKALDIEIVPVIYGDVIMNQNRGFEIYSGEKTLDLLARRLSKFYKKITIIYYTDTNGVYDNGKKTIAEITPKNFKKIKKYLSGSAMTDVTGGMLHKVQESLDLVKTIDAVVYIKNGLSRGSFTKIFRG
jgi:isopentenyl phosphate kinase